MAADPADPSRKALAFNDKAGARLIDSDLLAGGDMAGMLKFQNEDLVLARNRMGQMAAALSGMVNRQQAMGLRHATLGGGHQFRHKGVSAAQGAGQNDQVFDVLVNHLVSQTAHFHPGIGRHEQAKFFRLCYGHRHSIQYQSILNKC